MKFRILGPLEVRAENGEIALGGRKPRGILAMLLLQANRPVSSERLAAGLWGEDVPPASVKTIQVHVSRLRKALGDTASLETTPAGYRLTVDPNELDAECFTRRVADARRAHELEQFDRAAALLREALSLWRGPALADLAFEPFAPMEIAQLEEQRLSAIEARVATDLSAGRHEEIVAELQRLVAQHPTRERLSAHLMLALYRAGRQSEALEAYQTLRGVLVTEVGVEPGPGVRRLQEAVLQQEPWLDVVKPLDVHDGVPGAAGRDPQQTLGRPPMPLPAGLSGSPRLGYVGRAAQHEIVRRCWTAARAGSRQGFLISGEPGIGKTQFLTRSALELHEAGALVLLGHCSEDVAAPYGPWIQALTQFVEHASDALLEAHVQTYGGELARLVPSLPRRRVQVPAPRATDPESERYLLFWTVAGFLEQASVLAPLVLILEDLQWADPATLALLKHVLAETGLSRLLVIASYRDSDLSREHPLVPALASLRRQEQIEWLHLGGLDEHDVGSLLQAAVGQTGQPPDAALVRAITAETGGNAFFVGELLRNLMETGGLAVGGGETGALTAGLAGALPQSVREVVLDRVDRLGDHARQVLSCASVIGPVFDVGLVARARHDDPDAVIDALEHGVAAALLEEDQGGRFSFAHDLIMHTLYDALGATRRSRLHRQIAEAIEEISGDDRRSRVEELARHWLRAKPSDPLRASEYCRRAGEQALVQLAPDAALRWFTQSLDLLSACSTPGLTESCELRILLGEAQRQAGRAEFRETLLRAAALAAQLEDAERLARAALANSRGFASSFGVVDRERVEVLERAVELNRSSSPGTCARLLSLQAMELQFDPDYDRRRTLATEGLRLAREGRDLRGLAYVLRDHFHATWSADTLETRRDTAAEMMFLSTQTDDPLVRIWALDRSVHVAIESGTLGAATEVLAQLQAATEQLGQPGLCWHGAYFAAGLAQLRGNLRESERLADAARELGERAAEPDTYVIYAAQLAMVRNEQRRGDEMVGLLAQASADNPGISAYAAGHAAVLCDLGHDADAAPLLDQRAMRGFAQIPRDQTYLATLAMWAEVAAKLRAQSMASALYDLLIPWREQLVWNGAVGLGSLESHLGILAAAQHSHDRAQEHFAAASRLHRREGVRVWEARNLCHWASSLLASGALAEAVTTADRAFALASENGCELSVARASELRHLATTAGPGAKISI